MRILAVDAGSARSNVSRSVEIAATAAERAGASVVRIRLEDMDLRSCTNCGFCHAIGECRIPDDMSRVAQLVAEADGIIVGTPSRSRHAQGSARALCERLSRCSTAPERAHRAWQGFETPTPAEVSRPVSGNRRHAAKRAVIITSCSAPEPMATLLGYGVGPIHDLRGALGAGGIRTVGSLAMTDPWPAARPERRENERAASLGRLLAGKV